MKEAWRTLENLGAIDENGKLTALGRYMASLFTFAATGMIDNGDYLF